MSRLESIKNEYAKSHNYVCWDQFISDQPNYKKDQAYNDVYIVYAVECCTASLEKASDKLCEVLIDEDEVMVMIANKYCNSIIQESNIVIL